MIPAEERYMNDPIFHRLVETIYVAICEKQYTAIQERLAKKL